ncbi:Fic family protein [Candidatus Gottesmanbacteria bacterium]|nr:Fic family protein [Candidatus Gottesmanbacteria bacterium]
MFTPRYTITETLLSAIKRINVLVAQLNTKHFSHTILLQFEKDARALSSFASTSIEGNPLPLTDVKRILKSHPRHLRGSEQEVLNYNQALEALNAKLKKGPVQFNGNLILGIQRTVVKNLVPANLEGQLRTDAVFVNDPRTGHTVYWPPDATGVMPLMDALLQFVKGKRGAIDPIILAGLFHKQFVLIHPFMDGNGRTARLATKVLLAELGLDTFPLFSFEAYYNANVTRYFQFVGERGNYYDLFDSIDFTPWLEYFAEGIVDELLRVQKELTKHLVTPERELKPYHQKIIVTIKKNGYIRDPDYARLTTRAKATRNLDFKLLLTLGLIARKGKGKATYYVLKTE